MVKKKKTRMPTITINMNDANRCFDDYISRLSDNI